MKVREKSVDLPEKMFDTINKKESDNLEFIVLQFACNLPIIVGKYHTDVFGSHFVKISICNLAVVLRTT